MKKEKVIIFEGEQNFVIPKNRVRDKKTGISYYVPDEMNVTAPVGTRMEDPIEPPRQPDEPIGSPKTTTTQQEDALKPSTVPTDSTLASRGTLAQNDALSLGDRSSVMSDEEMTTTSTTTSTTTEIPKTTIPTLPIDTILAPRLSVGGGGGGGSKDGASAPKKTFLQKYWWLLLLVAAGGGYYYYKKKNK
jgi:hypothetical protein